MEKSDQTTEDDDQFFDAFDEFPVDDLTITDQSHPSTSILTDQSKPKDTTFPITTLRRRSRGRRRISAEESDGSNLESPEVSKERRYRFNPKERKRESEKLESTGDRVSSVSVSEQNNEKSTITTVNDERVGESVDSVDELGESSSSGLLFVAGLVIKAVGFQINFFISFITFPIWFTHQSYMFIIDPFRTLRCCREYLVGKLLIVWNLIYDSVSPLMCEWLKGHESIWKLAFRFGWGLLWSIYVCLILCSLMVFSLVVSGFVMRYLVVTPIQIEAELNFDYTKNSPVALVPIIGCGGFGCGLECKEMVEVGKSLGPRVIPPNHKLRVTVSMTVPESEYNRNLGVFQVRVNFLSGNGKTLASSSHPCMLQFKSEPIRLLQTFLEIFPLLAGYSSETQTLNLKLTGFTEGTIPTACIKVVLEQRAEFRSGAGIPEIYHASLLLESELPLFKRVIWYWKKTIFVWISMISFGMMFLCTIVCCRTLIIPRASFRNDSTGNSTSRNNLPAES